MTLINININIPSESFLVGINYQDAKYFHNFHKIEFPTKLSCILQVQIDYQNNILK